MSENPIEEIVDEVESLFTPKPGGMIDRHRQAEARREAAAREAENRNERVEEPGSYAVKVAPLSPEITSTNAVSIQPGATAMILPLSKYRYRATVMVDTASAKVVLAKDSNAALGGVGFTLPTGIPLVVNSRAQLYGMNPGGAAIVVSILAEVYAPETK